MRSWARGCIVASAVAATYAILFVSTHTHEHGGGGTDLRYRDDGSTDDTRRGISSDDVRHAPPLPADQPDDGAIRQVADAAVADRPDHNGDAVLHHTVVMGMLFVVVVEQSTADLAAMGTAMAGWVEHVLIPQHNLHLTVFYDPQRFSEASLLASAIGLEPLNATHHTLPRPNRFPVLLVAVPQWRALEAKHQHAAATTVCMAGATPWFVEAWLALDLFLHPVTRRYDYVARIAPDTRFFRRPWFPLIGEMRRLSAHMAHLGSSALEAVHRCGQGNVRRLDEQYLVGPPLEDRFVVLEMAPVLERKDLVEGWVAQHLTAFAGGLRAIDIWAATTSARGAAQWQWMQWRPKVLRKNAVLYHSQTMMSIDELKRWTRLRWSRVVRERVEF